MSTFAADWITTLVSNKIASFVAVLQIGIILATDSPSRYKFFSMKFCSTNTNTRSFSCYLYRDWSEEAKKPRAANVKKQREGNDKESRGADDAAGGRTTKKRMNREDAYNNFEDVRKCFVVTYNKDKCHKIWCYMIPLHLTWCLWFACISLEAKHPVNVLWLWVD